MKNLVHFKKVFQVIKTNCNDKDGLDGSKCHELVSRYLSEDQQYKIEHLIDHLNILQNMGLISFKTGDKIEITMTELGMKTSAIPSLL